MDDAWIAADKCWCLFSRLLFTLRYDTRCYFNVRSKADMSQVTPRDPSKWIFLSHLGWKQKLIIRILIFVNCATTCRLQGAPWASFPGPQSVSQRACLWPATHDYSGVMTPDYCTFQSRPVSGSALKINEHHCHKILRRNNYTELTLWLKLCRKSLQCHLKEKEI